jgi:hypothetical protein
MFIMKFKPPISVESAGSTLCMSNATILFCLFLLWKQYKDNKNNVRSIQNATVYVYTYCV